MKKETVRVYADINRRVDRWQSNNLYFGIVIGVLASNAVKMIFDGGGASLVALSIAAFLGIVAFAAMRYRDINSKELRVEIIKIRLEELCIWPTDSCDSERGPDSGE